MNDFSNYHLSGADILALLIVLPKKRFRLKRAKRHCDNLLRYNLIYRNYSKTKNELGENVPDGTYSVNSALAREYFISLRQNFYRSVLCPAIVAFITAFLTSYFL